MKFQKCFQQRKKCFDRFIESGEGEGLLKEIIR